MPVARDLPFTCFQFSVTYMVGSIVIVLEQHKITICALPQVPRHILRGNFLLGALMRQPIKYPRQMYVYGAYYGYIICYPRLFCF